MKTLKELTNEIGALISDLESRGYVKPSFRMRSELILIESLADEQGNNRNLTKENKDEH